MDEAEWLGTTVILKFPSFSLTINLKIEFCGPLNQSDLPHTRTHTVTSSFVFRINLDKPLGSVNITNDEEIFLVQRED